MRALRQRLRKATSALLRGDVPGPPLPPQADRVVTAAELLYKETPDAISIPMIPAAMTQSEHAESSIEFAAASVLDRVALAAFVRRHRPLRLFEIGTFRGMTAVTMAANAPSDAVLYTLDLPPSLSAEDIAARHYQNPASGFHQMATAGVARDVGRVLASHTSGCRIEQLFGDSSTMDFASFYDSIGLFFVDGCHEYEMALQDTHTAWLCLQSGGLLVWHDYPWRDVQAAIRAADLGVPVTFVRGTNLAFATKP